MAGVDPSMFETGTGVRLLVIELLPSWPQLLRPQHFTLPFAITAHEWLFPASAVTSSALHGPVLTEFTAATRNAYVDSGLKPVTVAVVEDEAVCANVDQVSAPTLRY